MNEKDAEIYHLKVEIAALKDTVEDTLGFIKSHGLHNEWVAFINEKMREDFIKMFKIGDK